METAELPELEHKKAGATVKKNTLLLAAKEKVAKELGYDSYTALMLEWFKAVQTEQVQKDFYRSIDMIAEVYAEFKYQESQPK